MTTYALIGLTAALIVLAAFLYMPLLREPKTAGRHRLTPDSPNNATALLDETNHDAPRFPFTRLEAHVAMQQHRKCPSAKCARKAAARDKLINDGIIKPRTR